MSLRHFLFFAALIIPPTHSVAGQSEGRPFTTDDALDVRSVRIGGVTPDGRWVAATAQTRRDRSGVDHFRFGDPTYIAASTGELLVIETRTGNTRSVFPAREQLREATWSPDGSRLAVFRLVEGRYQLQIYTPETGRVRAVALRTPRPISEQSPLAWSPDGSSILLTLRPEGWADSARRAFLDLTEGPVVVQDSRDDFLDWDRVRNLARREIPVLVTLADGSVRDLPALSSAPQGLRFSPDGMTLAYGVTEPKRTSYKRAAGTEYGFYRLHLATGVIDTVVRPSERRITGEWNRATTAMAWADRGNIMVWGVGADSARNLTASHRTPLSPTDTTKLRFTLERWNPSGDALLARSQRGLHVLDPATAELRTILEFAGPEETRPRLGVQGWSPDGRSVFLSVSERDRWARGLVRLDLETGRLEDLRKDTNVYGDWTMSEDGSTVVFRMSDGHRPDDLHVADIGFSRVRRLTDLNPQLTDVALARTELVSYRDVDGNTLYGILYYARNHTPGKRYPLVAEIYEEFFDNGYNENMNLVTARGWFGFRPSVRFETGYPGEAWLKGVPNAINTLIERGLVDEKQVGVYGQSYGGYAVNLLVTQTDRFAAAANVSGKVNIVSFLGDSPRITTRNYNAAEEGQDRIGATLWEQPHKYVATSAVMFADRIKTPLLLLSGEGDWNVPATNQREMYYALRRLGKEVVWVNYMKGGHGAGRASDVADFADHWTRLLDWMGDHFAKAVKPAGEHADP